MFVYSLVSGLVHMWMWTGDQYVGIRGCRLWSTGCFLGVAGLQGHTPPPPLTCEKMYFEGKVSSLGVRKRVCLKAMGSPAFMIYPGKQKTTYSVGCLDDLCGLVWGRGGPGGSLGQGPGPWGLHLHLLRGCK